MAEKYKTVQKYVHFLLNIFTSIYFCETSYSKMQITSNTYLIMILIKIFIYIMHTNTRSNNNTICLYYYSKLKAKIHNIIRLIY